MTATSETEKVAEAQEEVVDENVEILYKYAAFADQKLAEEFGNDYTEEDVVKLLSNSAKRASTFNFAILFLHYIVFKS